MKIITEVDYVDLVKKSSMETVRALCPNYGM